ncbi:MAG: hypothetical protein AAF790_11390, partial [Planctomycetota bacterium]
AVLRRLSIHAPGEAQAPEDKNAPRAWAEAVGGPEDSLLLVEAESLSPIHVAAQLIGNRRDYAELAKRVHTRKDIAWRDPLESASAAADTAAADTAAHDAAASDTTATGGPAPLESAAPQHTQVLTS